MPRKPYVEILFKSGERVTFDATKLSTKYSQATGVLTDISWEGATNAPIYLQLASIDMVRFVTP